MEFEGKSWRNTIIKQRVALDYLLCKNPGLKSVLADAVAEAYPQATDLAAAETDLSVATFPAHCPHPIVEILGRAYYPPID